VRDLFSRAGAVVKAQHELALREEDLKRATELTVAQEKDLSRLVAERAALGNECDRLSKIVASKDQELSTLVAERAVLTSNFDQLHRDLLTKEQELSTSLAGKLALDRECNRLSQIIVSKEERVSKLVAERETMEENLNELDRDLATKELELSKSAADQALRDSDFNRLSEILAANEEKLSKFAGELACIDRDYKHLRKDDAAKDQQLVELVTEREGYARDCEQLRELLVAKEEDFSYLLRECENLRIDLSCIRDEVVKKDQELSEIRRKKSALDIQSEEYNQIILGREKILVELKAENKEKSVDLEYKKNNLELAEKKIGIVVRASKTLRFESKWLAAKILQQNTDLDQLSKLAFQTGSHLFLSRLKKSKIVFSIGLVIKALRTFSLSPVRDLVEVAQISGSDLFDKNWYLRKNIDVALADMNPAYHYLRYGYLEGRDPGPEFSTNTYLNINEDVASAGANPLLHFLKYGRHEGRRTKIKIDEILFERSDKKLKSNAKSIIENGCLIVAPPHVLGLANLYAYELEKVGFVTKVSSDLCDQNMYQHLFVFCPNVFSEEMKSGYIAVQFEQTTNSRWFETDYLVKLRKASAILDYSIENIEFLKNTDIDFSRLFFVPVGVPGASSENEYLRFDERDIDVLFYGDDQCPRRAAYLAELGRHFRVKILNNTFGKSVWDMIRRSKIVVNIHYYDPALLEIPRLCECMSLGTPVISEEAIDIESQDSFNPGVEFVESGNIEAMVKAVKKILDDPNLHEDRVRACYDFAQKRYVEFNWHFRRFLYAQNMISLETLDETRRPEGERYSEGGKLFLTLPETPMRLSAFRSQRRYEFGEFKGFRHRFGWIGCGLSYRSLAKEALANKVSTLTVCEDDADFPHDYVNRLAIVQKYLEMHSDWDVFSGFMADLSPDARVLKVEEFNGEKFVWLDRMISMVYNIYSDRALKILSDWSPLDHNVQINTIDRYMERQSIKVVVLYPFLVGHQENLTSTLWGIENKEYNKLISRTHVTIQKLIQDSELDASKNPLSSSGFD
jgi:GR25 family glycosyltransferase involved in LPS biosynthesis